MERKVGEVFGYKGVNLEVVEVEDKYSCCDGCYFYNMKYCRFEKVSNITGFCGAGCRKDKRHVVFKEMKVWFGLRIVREINRKLREVWKIITRIK